MYYVTKFCVNSLRVRALRCGSFLKDHMNEPPPRLFPVHENERGRLTVDIAFSRREEHRHAYWTMITRSSLSAEKVSAEVVPVNRHVHTTTRSQCVDHLPLHNTQG